MFRPGVQRVTWGGVRALDRIAAPVLLRGFVRSLSKMKVGDVLRELSRDDRSALRALLRQRSSGEGFLLDREHEVPREILAGGARLEARRRASSRSSWGRAHLW